MGAGQGRETFCNLEAAEFDQTLVSVVNRTKLPLSSMKRSILSMAPHQHSNHVGNGLKRLNSGQNLAEFSGEIRTIQFIQTVFLSFGIGAFTFLD